jgi:hypothetical protein
VGPGLHFEKRESEKPKHAGCDVSGRGTRLSGAAAGASSPLIRRGTLRHRCGISATVGGESGAAVGGRLLDVFWASLVHTKWHLNCSPPVDSGGELCFLVPSLRNELCPKPRGDRFQTKCFESQFLQGDGRCSSQGGSPGSGRWRPAAQVMPRRIRSRRYDNGCRRFLCQM